MNLELYITKGDSSGHHKPLTHPQKILVGREATCGLAIPDPLLSRQHCEITVTPQYVKVKDLGSRNGTFVNGRRLVSGSEVVLGPNDEVKVGRHAFQVVESKQNSAAPQAQANTQAVVGACSQCGVRVFQRDLQEMRAIRHGANLYCKACLENGIELNGPNRGKPARRPIVQQQPTETEIQVPTFAKQVPPRIPKKNGGIGSTIGPYQILQILGEGGMGAVYKAKHSILETIVAIKVIKEELASQDEVVKRFLREAKLGVSLNHPNVLQIIDAGQADGVYYIVMEFFEGKDLTFFVKQRGPLPAQQLVKLSVQMADALSHAHKHKVIHRDVKPSNILVDNRTGIVKLADFGLAKAWQKAGAHQLTASGQMLGTIQYISPEQLEDARGVSPKTDIFSLGASLYYALTGRAPFGEEPLGKVIENILHNPPPPLSHIPNLPAGLEPAIMKALAKKSDERYETMDDFKDDLIKIAQSS